jgi:hypothetical protein
MISSSCLRITVSVQREKRGRAKLFERNQLIDNPTDALFSQRLEPPKGWVGDIQSPKNKFTVKSVLTVICL